ncbi:DUF4158 domain-containing protein [Sphaerisporangium corydalis]|uniref:DUF4158 domain-containing protein n=2 Tax=Sphaerisporangium corydalis TaxID=1441875 RepID=A0ABV9EDJ7_9ACTN
MRAEWEPDELIGSWTLVEGDWKLIRNKSGATRLGFALLLKFYELEGRFPDGPQAVPLVAVDYVASLVKVDAGEFAKYRWTGRTIEYHRKQIRGRSGRGRRRRRMRTGGHGGWRRRCAPRRRVAGGLLRRCAADAGARMWSRRRPARWSGWWGRAFPSSRWRSRRAWWAHWGRWCAAGCRICWTVRMCWRS